MSQRWDLKPKIANSNNPFIVCRLWWMCTKHSLGYNFTVYLHFPSKHVWVSQWVNPAWSSNCLLPCLTFQVSTTALFPKKWYLCATKLQHQMQLTSFINIMGFFFLWMHLQCRRMFIQNILYLHNIHSQNIADVFPSAHSNSSSINVICAHVRVAFGYRH